MKKINERGVASEKDGSDCKTERVLETIAQKLSKGAISSRIFLSPLPFRNLSTAAGDIALVKTSMDREPQNLVDCKIFQEEFSKTLLDTRPRFASRCSHVAADVRLPTFVAKLSS